MVAVPDPAAGQNMDYEIPVDVVRELVTWTFTFVASATVANRRVLFSLEDSLGTTYWIAESPVSQTAGQTRIYSAYQGASRQDPATVATAVRFDLPRGFVLPRALRLRTIIVSLQAGDQISGIQLGVRRVAF